MSVTLTERHIAAAVLLILGLFLLAVLTRIFVLWVGFQLARWLRVGVHRKAPQYGPEPDGLPPLPCEGLCVQHVGDPAANNRCAEPCDRIVPHALHLCAEHRVGPDGLPKPRNWPPPTVRTQDDLGQSTMVLPRMGTTKRPAPLGWGPPEPKPSPPPREWRVGRAPSPFVINPPDVRTLAFRLMLPVIQPEPDEPDPVGVAERIRQHYRDQEWPVTEFLYHHAWFDTEGLAA